MKTKEIVEDHVKIAREKKVLEKQLTEKFKNFRDIMIYAIDADFRIIYYNKTFKEKIFDVYNNQIKDKGDFKDIVRDTEDFRTLDTSHNFSLEGKTFSNIQRFNFEGARYYECFYSPLYGNDGQIKGSISFMRDLSEIAEEVKLIKDSEEQIKRVANVLKLGLVIQEVIYDNKGEPIDCEFKFINKKYENITGLKLEKIKGKRITEVIPDAKEGSFWIDKYKIAITSGETVNFEHFAPFIQKWFNITAYSPIQNRLVLLLTDISVQKEAEEKLRKSEELYRGTVENLAAGVIVCDRKGKILSANPEAQRSKVRIMEDGAVPLEKTNIIYYNEDKEELTIAESPFARAFVTKEIVLNQVIGTKIEGTETYIWISLTVIPILNEKNEIERLILNFLDISQKKEMEEKMVEDRNKLYLQKKQVDATLMAIAEGVVSTTPDGYIISVNKVASELTEWSSKEALGKHFEEVINIVNDEGKKKRGTLIKTSDKEESKRLRRTLISKSNKEYQIELSVSSVINVDDEITGAVVIFRNITEELKMISDLNIERQRLNRVIEASTDVLVEVNRDLVITSLSGKGLNIFDIKAKDYINKPLGKIFNSKNDNRDYAFHCALQGKQYTYDWDYTKNGITLWFESTVSPIFDVNNEVIGALNVIKETTEKKEKLVEIEFLSTHDGLTKIHNRHYFHQKLKTLDYSYHYPLGIIWVDMNNLKLINDIFGHQVGDEALKEIANVLKLSFRQEDVVTRISGDEFSVILPNTTVERLEQRKKLIKDRIRDLDFKKIPLAVAIGYKMKTKESEKMDEILKEAENNMYEDKRLNSSIYNNSLIPAFQKNLYDTYPEELIHRKKTEELCEKFSKHLNLNKDDAHKLATASKVHDLGKLFIPVNVYNKKEKLTALELETCQQHVNFAHRILKQTTDYGFVADCVRSHHENWDGSGYPYGLKEDAIPYVSRILAIIDSYSAMTSKRPYRDALSHEEAKKELKRQKDKKFDPKLLEEFLKIIE